MATTVSYGLAMTLRIAKDTTPVETHVNWRTNMIGTDRVDQVLDCVMQVASDAKGFALAQAPLVAQEIVSWTFWSSILYAAVYTLLCVFAVLAIYVTARRLDATATSLKDDATQRNKDTTWAYIPPSDDVKMRYVGQFRLINLASVLVVCLFAGPIANSIGWAIKASVAPRVVLIEELKRMTR